MKKSPKRLRELMLEIANTSNRKPQKVAQAARRALKREKRKNKS